MSSSRTYLLLKIFGDRSLRSLKSQQKNENTKSLQKKESESDMRFRRLRETFSKWRESGDWVAL